MLHIWDAVEADFLRDYGIQLVEQLNNISWRKFTVLLNNLSPHGAVAMRMSMEESKAPEESPEDDEAAANAFFARVVSM